LTIMTGVPLAQSMADLTADQEVFLALTAVEKQKYLGLVDPDRVESPTPAPHSHSEAVTINSVNIDDYRESKRINWDQFGEPAGNMKALKDQMIAEQAGQREHLNTQISMVIRMQEQRGMIKRG
jgi:hypothetical protein